MVYNKAEVGNLNILGVNEMTTLQKMLLCIFLVFAVIFIGSLPFKPYLYSFAIKVIPALSLTALAFVSVTGSRGKLLFTSLLFCAAADVALEIAGGEILHYRPGVIPHCTHNVHNNFLEGSQTSKVTDPCHHHAYRLCHDDGFCPDTISQRYDNTSLYLLNGYNFDGCFCITAGLEERFDPLWSHSFRGFRFYLSY